ncbi:MAG: hypothetical protein RR904_06170 [Bacilli bacterium]
MGFEKKTENTPPEKNNQKQEIETGKANKTYEIKDGNEKQKKPQSNMKLLTLKTISDKIEQKNEKEWLIEIGKGIEENFKRMPKGGWDLLNFEYKKKYGKEVEINDIKYKIKSTTNSKRKIENEQATKRRYNGKVKVIDICKIHQIFLDEIIKAKKLQIKDRETTKKIFSETINAGIMEMINRIVASYVRSDKPNNMTDISNILYAAQITYEKATKKEAKESKWKQNIENKIKALEVLKQQVNDHLWKIKEGAKTKLKNRIQIDELKKFKIKKWNLNDMKRTALEIEETIKIYQRKIEIHENRKSFRRDNKFF